MISDRLFMLGLATLALTGGAVAQTQPKVAVINLQQAVLATDEIKKASEGLEAKYKPRQAELQKLQTELEGIQQKLQAGQGKLTPQAEGDLNYQGQRIQRDLQRKGQDLQEEVDAERNAILGTAGRKMQGVVQKLAEARGFDVVIEANSTVYARDTVDITKEATAEYNKTGGAPPAAAPAK
jgi:outer membrane protein